MNSNYNNSSTILTVKIPQQIIRKRFGNLCNSENLADIYFILKKDKEQRRIPAHKFVLSLGSEVFKKMFFGSLAIKSDTIGITDVEPAAFMVLLNFLYFNEVQINFKIVTHTLYVAKKYVVPALEKHCVDFLKKNLTTDNVFLLLKQALLYDKPDLKELCLTVIEKNTTEVLEANGSNDIDLKLLILILKQDKLQVFESKLFQYIVWWSEIECARKKLPVTPKNQRSVLGEALTLIRYSFMTIKEFIKGPIQSGLLTEMEIKQFLQDIALNANSMERPRCSNSHLESRLKFYTEMTPITMMQFFSETKPRPKELKSVNNYFNVKQNIFVVGFIVLNIFRHKSNVKLTLEKYEPLEQKFTVSQSNNLIPAPDVLTFMFDKPIMLPTAGSVDRSYAYGLETSFDELAEDDVNPIWKPLKTGEIEQCGQRKKKMNEYFDWGIGYDPNIIYARGSARDLAHVTRNSDDVQDLI
ncbi:BTB/POZ domain-containing protein 2-like [Chrysoperla carnea]|uniref:BTB/POZ domain-containing protein 2-like n=1 Tax=Chrysoperla carnea TaxID=189513 RepID=UPI001D064356|nr:BTB/POZ domain-containing protein 2-like [Chrysoperla carnea]